MIFVKKIANAKMRFGVVCFVVAWIQALCIGVEWRL
ncbi:hypothetical protein HCCG_00288 [Helicobacter cinaedi CCUG 18818 = ATCC BAA-847]|uniref:Uncharacterized protein n=1 Tax=Helicobacter cinaedi CCUG 18818 = ATCC BAA-847 TaxID=537971 RepID=A0ABN0B8A0_9HELI|nr:hypothetical protein HCCG_00288 [Helicobacter cinaedi CCUG 18818 = ATCC BAA-847]